MPYEFKEFDEMVPLKIEKFISLDPRKSTKMSNALQSTQSVNTKKEMSANNMFAMSCEEK